jgi:hypothetical protein
MGDYTTNNVFYKPALGAAGTTEKTTFDAALDTADATITAVVSTASTALSVALTGSGVAATALSTASTALSVALTGSGVAAAAIPAPSATSGDLLYYDGSDWVVLAIGATGEVLTVTATGGYTWA